MNRVLRILFLSLILASFASATESNNVIVERGVAAKMRDGVTLRADIYRPKSDGKFPVILQRTPLRQEAEACLANQTTGNRLCS